MRATAIVGRLLCAALLLLVFGAASAKADRELQSEAAVYTLFCANCPQPSKPLPPLVPPPEGQIEGPCGLAIAPGGNIYVSDYYHRVIDVYSGAGNYVSTLEGVAPSPEGPCGLAIDATGALYVNVWHQRVVRLKPTPQVFDTGHSTGVAVDDSGNVYVNDRTYVAVYEPSGAPVLDGGQPLRIGLGSLGDAYGLAVDGTSPSDARVYVPDASDRTVKVYEPGIDPDEPADVIVRPGGFRSLIDAAVTVDRSSSGNHHVLVLDNLQPGYVHPLGGIYEFDPDGSFLGQAEASVINGEPAGMAVDPGTGRLYVTDGNDELSNVFSFGPYVESGFASAPLQEEPGVLLGAGRGPAGEWPDASSAVVSGPGRDSAPHRRRSQRRRRTRRGPWLSSARALSSVNMRIP
jgi:DNA-binding beta-propeller fold protein YncE